ncbi:Mu transposase C-terminal domain-containing protein [Marivibrio halodurans]|uniref:Mu transposase C-terminal domain-containing protein n=1 Tax=Marivibrio halodurans TaxID=2039722 RepID=A0A8J7SIT4_9PROT|nr:transposase domain-containing protein [Marivibrio halodurans]MBP5857258.1 Mu transposase C-terminal domain-containing protein [Marivibrio halodurans]
MTVGREVNGAYELIEWWTTADLASLSLEGLPQSQRGVLALAKKHCWQGRRTHSGNSLARRRAGRGGGWEYHYSLLPLEAQQDLLHRYSHERLAAEARLRPAPADTPRRNPLWEIFERLGGNAQDTAKWRLAVLNEVEDLTRGGMNKNGAVHMVSRHWKQQGKRISARTLWNWFDLVAGLERSDWLPALAPRHVGRTKTAQCSQEAWDWYKGHYLTRKKPTHADTYNRLKKIADAKGWTIPTARTLVRRMDSEVEEITQIYCRKGAEAAARRMPTQRRDATVFGAGEAVNGDGLKFDRLWVRFTDGEIINTATAWFYQDVRTRRILAWRLDKTENTDLFRLATYDLTGVCAPAHVYIDNTTVAANKLMTAGAKGRKRFKDGPEDGLGLLLMLGMDPHFTNPDEETGNPGAKPIERAFGIGGLHEMVATNPALTDRGYSKATAISSDELRAVIAHEVERHNAKTGRRTQACGGVLSFDQAWEAAIGDEPVRVLSDRQRRLLLLSREVARADGRDGAITLEAGQGPHGRNRYWCEHLTQWAGRKVAVHYDPEDLRSDVHIYSLDGRYLFAAESLPTAGFNDTKSGREWRKFKSRMMKAEKAKADAEQRMDALVRASIYADATNQPIAEAPKKKRQTRPVVVAGHFQHVPDPASDAGSRDDEDDDARVLNFVKGVAKIAVGD